MPAKKIEWSRTTLTIAVLSMLAAGSWIGFDLYRALVKSTLPSVLQAQLLPLQTSIDEETVSNLRSRSTYSDATLDQVQSVAVEAPTPPPSKAGADQIPLGVVELIAPSTPASSSATATGSAQLDN